MYIFAGSFNSRIGNSANINIYRSEISGCKEGKCIFLTRAEPEMFVIGGGGGGDLSPQEI